MQRVGIIGAMECEVEKITEQLVDIQIREIAGKKYFIGEIDGVEAIVVCSGIGKVNAASCTQILIDLFQVHSIINTGVAGAISQKLAIGDIVISRDVTYHDIRPQQMRCTFPFQETFSADPLLIELAETAVKENEEIVERYYIERIVSGEIFIEDSGVKERIRRDLDAACVEMEGGAVGHTATMNDTPFLVIRSISDQANEDATVNFQEFVLRAAEQSCHLVVSMLRKLSQYREE